MHNFRHKDALVRAIGSISTTSLMLRRRFNLRAPVKVSLARRKLLIRPSDRDLFQTAQVFGTGDYDLSPELLVSLNRIALDWRAQGVTPVIIDIGANIGCSSLFFADTFPDAEILAIEPDIEAIKILIDNCARERRIHALHGKVWPRATRADAPAGDIGSWMVRVQGVNDVLSFTLDTLMTRFDKAQPLMIKLDMEGAAQELGKQSIDVFGDVPCILVEPHDVSRTPQSAVAPLVQSLAARDKDTIVFGENLCLLDPRLIREMSF